MRVTIIFFLAACVLGLTYWAWTLTPSRVEYDPLIGAKPKYEDIKKIMNSTNIEFLSKRRLAGSSTKGPLNETELRLRL